MIAILMRAAWISLTRDRVALVMLFVVPIAFFSIFAVIFGGRDAGSTSRVAMLLVDESHTAASAAMTKALAGEPGIKLQTSWAPPNAARGAAQHPLDRARAEALVRSGDSPVAIVLPAGLDTSLSRFDGRGVKVLVLSDPSDPIAPRMVLGVLQHAALTAAPPAAISAPGGHLSIEDQLPVRIEQRALLGEKHTSPMVSFYAAGIAVMFLMFSASAAGGALLEESESGTLERVLTSRAGMTHLLLARWLGIARTGVMQIVVMFLWGMFVFKLPLLGHLPGFALMTVATAACASAFGLVLATLSRSRQQLQGLANLIVLSLSAIGGSMFPRFLMSETLQKLSLVGFNAWALDGFIKVFWRDAPVLALWPELAALAGFTVLFLALARRLAMRWESA